MQGLGTCTEVAKHGTGGHNPTGQERVEAGERVGRLTSGFWRLALSPPGPVCLLHHQSVHIFKHFLEGILLHC